MSRITIDLPDDMVRPESSTRVGLGEYVNTSRPGPTGGPQFREEVHRRGLRCEIRGVQRYHHSKPLSRLQTFPNPKMTVCSIGGGREPVSFSVRSRLSSPTLSRETEETALLSYIVYLGRGN